MISQRQRLLDKMEQDGFVNSYYATYNMSIKQAPTRIHELKKLGHIITKTTNKDGSVDWHLGIAFKPKAEDFVFTSDGHAIPKEKLKPEQLKF